MRLKVVDKVKNKLGLPSQVRCQPLQVNEKVSARKVDIPGRNKLDRFAVMT